MILELSDGARFVGTEDEILSIYHKLFDMTIASNTTEKLKMPQWHVGYDITDLKIEPTVDVSFQSAIPEWTYESGNR